MVARVTMASVLCSIRNGRDEASSIGCSMSSRISPLSPQTEPRHLPGGTEFMGTTNQPGAKSPLRRTWVRIVVGIGMSLLVLVLLAVLVLKTIRFRSRQLMVQAISVTSPLDGFAERLGRALAFPTIAAEP